jgi:hypothetical protein
MGAIAHEMGIHATYEPPLTESNAKKRSTLMGQFRRPNSKLIFFFIRYPEFSKFIS